MNAFILACVGVAMEVAFTAACEGGWRLQGQSYLWMFPIYALLYPGFLFIRPFLGEKPWWVRAPLYAVGILIVEYAAGWGLRLVTGSCPWDYGDARWAIHGVIGLDYAPLWAGAALFYEHVALKILWKDRAVRD